MEGEPGKIYHGTDLKELPNGPAVRTKGGHYYVMPKGNHTLIMEKANLQAIDLEQGENQDGEFVT